MNLYNVPARTSSSRCDMLVRVQRAECGANRNERNVAQLNAAPMAQRAVSAASNSAQRITLRSFVATRWSVPIKKL
jgi:hypothetical protein